jgi:hypothetical protein
LGNLSRAVDVESAEVIGKTRVVGREGVVAQMAGKVVKRDQAPAITVHRPQYRLGRIVIRGAFAIRVRKLDTRAVRGAGETEECENVCEDDGQLLGCALFDHQLERTSGVAFDIGLERTVSRGSAVAGLSSIYGGIDLRAALSAPSPVNSQSGANMVMYDTSASAHSSMLWMISSISSCGTSSISSYTSSTISSTRSCRSSSSYLCGSLPLLYINPTALSILSWSGGVDACFDCGV